IPLVLIVAMVILSTYIWHLNEIQTALLAISILAPYYVLLYLLRNKMTKIFTFTIKKRRFYKSILIMNAILIVVALLGTIGAVSATIVYIVGQKFKVLEDPLIEQVNDSLPGAIFGGCGFPGCRGFASAIVKAETMDGLFCPVGGQETMDKIASILGKSAPA